MYKNKFYLVFSRLEKKEQEAFQSYLLNNHRKKKVAIKVYLFLIVEKQKQKKEAWTKEEMYPKIFGKKEKYSYRKLIDAFSDLYLLFEEFLIWNELIQNKITEKDSILLEIFKKRNFEKLYRQKINQIKKKQELEKRKDAWSFLSEVKLNHRQYFLSDNTKLINGADTISEAMNHLDLFFVATKLRYSCELFSRENILQEKYEIKFLNQIIQLCETEQQFQTAYFKVYYQTLQLIRYQRQVDFLKLKELFFENIELFKPRELMGLFSYLINYTASNIKKGQTEFVEEAFQLYDRGLKEWVFIEDNYMSHTRFNNIINIACRLNKIEWAKQFIEQWKSYLEKEIRKSAVNLGWSRLYFEDQAYDLVIDQLNEVEFSNSYYAIRAKILLIRSHCELKTDPRVITHLCKAFVNYIRRNKTINVETKKGFLNFAKTLLKILGQKHKTETLRRKLEEINPVVYKDWLFQQIR